MTKQQRVVFVQRTSTPRPKKTMHTVQCTGSCLHVGLLCRPYAQSRLILQTKNL